MALFSWTLLLVFVLCFVRKRRFDLFTVLIASYIYYYSPLILGVSYNPSGRKFVLLDDLLYLQASIFLMLASGFAVAYDLLSKNLELKRNHDRTIDFALFYIGAAIIMFLGILSTDANFFFPNFYGDTLPAALGPVYPLFVLSALTAFVFAWSIKAPVTKVLSTIFLVLTLTAGSRAHILAFILIVTLLYTREQEGIRLVFNPRVVLVGATVFFSLVFYKVAFPFILSRDFEGLVSAVSNWESVAYRIFLGGESFLVILNHHYSVAEEGIRAFSSDYPSMYLAKLIPFFSQEIADAVGVNLLRYSAVLKDNYAQVEFGMGSSFWGELSFLFGNSVLLYTLSVIMFMGVIFTANHIVMTQSFIGKVLTPPSVLVCFYHVRMEGSGVMFQFYLAFALVLVAVTFIYLLELIRNQVSNRTQQTG